MTNRVKGTAPQQFNPDRTYVVNDGDTLQVGVLNVFEGSINAFFPPANEQTLIQTFIAEEDVGITPNIATVNGDTIGGDTDVELAGFGGRVFTSNDSNEWSF